MTGPTGSVAGWRQRLWETRAQVIAALASLSPADLTRPWRWRGVDDDVRFALHRVADDDSEAVVAMQTTLAALGWAPPEAARILALAEQSRGLLTGALVGVPDDLLDAVPAPGAWPLRQVLAHIVLSERRYYQRAAWDIAEARLGRATYDAPPAGIVEPLTEVDQYTRGGVYDFLERLEIVRNETHDVLADVVDSDLDAVSSWAGHRVNVRFRLHRFAAHEREHTIQVQQALRDINFTPSEAHQILSAAQVTRGYLLGHLVGLPDSWLERAPDGGRRSVATILADLDRGEHDCLASIRAALTS